ncbi:MAG: hypothetical protein JWO04_1483 [Gammaproteobacteria bacterium]|nr:hypothetical protein [Gammaproteobacteria bacterium]
MTSAALASMDWGDARAVFWSIEDDRWGIELVPGKYVAVRAKQGLPHSVRMPAHWFYVVRPDRGSGRRTRMKDQSGRALEWPEHKPSLVRRLLQGDGGTWRQQGREHRPVADHSIEAITVGEALCYYLRELESHHARPRTIDGVRKTWNRYACLKLIKTTHLWSLTRDDVKRLHRSVYQEIRLGQAQRLAKKANSPCALEHNSSLDSVDQNSVSLPIQIGGRVSDHAIQMLREIINVQRLRIDSEADRPPNVTRVMSEGKGLWNSRKLGVNEDEPRPLSDSELDRLIVRLNGWKANPVHRAAVLLVLAGGFRRERAITIEWSWVLSEVIHFPRHTAKGKKKVFKFPVTPQLYTLLEQCRSFGGSRFVTPQRALPPRPEKPLNNFDWSETALAGVGDTGKPAISAHNLRDTVSTRLTRLTNGNPLAAICVLDQQSRLKQLMEIGVRYSELDTQVRDWVSLWHRYLHDRGLRFG